MPRQTPVSSPLSRPSLSRSFGPALLLCLLLSGALTPAVAATAAGVHAWAYQLQGIDPAVIRDEGTSRLTVIDYSSTGGEDGEWTPEQIAQMKSDGKTLVAYISIGEAEDYRFYWDPTWETDPPLWLGPENPDWPGNYKVRYWMEDWQQVIFSYLDRIVAQGFDGIYMDIIDAYYYWSEENPEKPDAEVDMIRFVARIRDYLSQTHGRPGMVMLPQNGEYIIFEDDTTPELRRLYFDSIDAIGVEDLFFPGPADEDNPYNPDPVRIDTLSHYLAAGKCVYSIEYLTDPATIDLYRQKAEEQGYYPYASIRALDVLSPGLPTYYAPGEVPEGGEGQEPLTLAKVAAGLRLDWDGVCGADTYQIYRGDLTALPHTGYDHQCEASGLTETSAELPEPVGAAYYLVTARNPLGESDPGRDSSGLPRPLMFPCP